MRGTPYEGSAHPAALFAAEQLPAKECDQPGDFDVSGFEDLAEIDATIVVDELVPHPRHGRPGHGSVGALEIVAESLGNLTDQEELMQDG